MKGRRVAGRERLGRRLVETGAHAVAMTVRDVVVEGRAEGLLGRSQRYPVLRTLRAGEGRLDRGEVELEGFRIGGLPGRIVPETLLLGIRLDERHLLGRPSGESQITQGLVVNREDRAGGAVLR